jgi:hypothetical protein
MLARAIQRSGDPWAAIPIADAGIDHVRQGGWTAVLPWPMVVGAACALAIGERDAAADRFAEALTLGTEIGDPCWEALALHGLGLLRLPEDADAAIQLLEEGVGCCRRYTDVYPWARAVILADLVEIQHGSDARILDEAYDLAVYGPMPDIAERLAPYRRTEILEISDDLASTQTQVQTAAP